MKSHARRSHQCVSLFALLLIMMACTPPILVQGARGRWRSNNDDRNLAKRAVSMDGEDTDWREIQQQATYAANTSSPSYPAKKMDENLANGFILVGSFFSAMSIVFTLVLYLHYSHLHSSGNNVFMAVLGVDLFECINLFACIFFVPLKQRHTKTHCQICGFLEQVYSFAEPAFNMLFWVYIYMLVNGATAIYNKQRVRRMTKISSVVIFLVAIATALVALIGGMYATDGQAWCWIGDDYTWFRFVFCWFWMMAALVVMIVALLKPLTSDLLTDRQRGCLKRRGTLALVWFLVNFVDVLARFVDTRNHKGILYLQAFVNPLTGILNVLAFLYSERMLTWRALGLPPGADPPYGFTAAMRDIPAKLAFNEAYNNAPLMVTYHTAS